MSHPVRTISWQWPYVGATPISQGLDSEIFDTREVPHAQTFVREAIQNSLDARLDRTKPVTVRFKFSEGPLGRQADYLADLKPKRAQVKLDWPTAWAGGRASWLTVEDFNTTGLLGDLQGRTSDFWNYWMNFGLSNKAGSGRGGRGIGRVTFLIASELAVVIGLTRRSSDDRLVACGMGVLRFVQEGDDLRSGYAYLAAGVQRNIFGLYDTADFHEGLIDAFDLASRKPGDTGLSLVIPYPRKELSAPGIVAAAIEHFGPAIVAGTLVVDVDGKTVSADSIDAAALEVLSHFGSDALREQPIRILDLERRTTEPPSFSVRIDHVDRTLADNIGEQARAAWRAEFEKSGRLAIELEIPVRRNGNISHSSVRAVVARTPQNVAAADLFFRGGMCLPKVVARRPADIDLVLQASDGVLVEYLNLCEGKAHLDLTEHSEVKQKLKEAGFSTNFSEKRFVRKLVEDIRTMVLPDPTSPDSSVFARYFSTPSSPSPAGSKKVSKRLPKNIVVVDPPEPKIRALIIDTLESGFRVRANPEFSNWPLTVRIEAAYADGKHRPSWSRWDFELAKLPMALSGGDRPRIKDNVMQFFNCTADFSVEVTGFDAKRELIAVTSVRRPVEANGGSDA